MAQVGRHSSSLGDDCVCFQASSLVYHAIPSLPRLSRPPPSLPTYVQLYNIPPHPPAPFSSPSLSAIHAPLTAPSLLQHCSFLAPRNQQTACFLHGENPLTSFTHSLPFPLIFLEGLFPLADERTDDGGSTFRKTDRAKPQPPSPPPSSLTWLNAAAAHRPQP